MTEQQIALARRAVACRGWRWMPGMLALAWAAPGMSLTGGRPLRVDDGWHEVGVYVPDLTDPATLGCLLALVREAWRDPHASVWYDSEYWQSGNRWSWHAKEQSRVDYDSEAEALVAALEAAP